MLYCDGQVLIHQYLSKFGCNCFWLLQSPTPLILTLIMTRGKRLSGDLRKSLVYMFRSCSLEKIVAYTGCKKRTVQRVLQQHRTMPAWPIRELWGRKRVLIRTDVRVSTLWSLESVVFMNLITIFLPSFSREWSNTHQISTLMNCRIFWKGGGVL